MDLNALKDFVAVADHGGYTEAERATGAPKSSLSRRVAGLERALGVRLLERDARRVRLTVEGLELHRRAKTLLIELGEAGQDISAPGAPLRGRLKVSVPVLFGHSFLGAVAAAYVKRHPGVLLEAVLDDRPVDLLREGFDAAMRVNPRPDSTLTGRIVARNRLVLVAPAALARDLGAGGGGDSWPAVVRPGWGDDGGWDVVVRGRAKRIPATPVLALSSPLAMRDAVLAGAGAALLPRTIVSSDIAAGRLVELGERGGAPDEVWIVHASGRLPSRRLSAFIDLVAEFFARSGGAPPTMGLLGKPAPELR